MRIRFPYGSLLLLSILTLAVGAAHAASAKAPLLFIAAPSNSNATTHVEQVMRQTKLALEAQGYRGEILLSSAERPRFLRLVTQKQLRQSDVDLLHKPEVALRVCQAMSCRLGMLVDVTPTEVMPTREATALTVNLTLVYPDTEKLDNLEGITAQQTEFIPNPKKPKRKEIKTAYQVAGERIAQVLSERVSKLPSGDQPRQSLADAHIAKSKEHLTRNQLAEALDEAYQAMALAPNNPEPYALAGDVFVAQEDWEGARVQYERALQKSPEDAKVWVKLADAYMKQTKPDSVVQMAEKRVPDTIEANVLAAKAYLARREVAQRAGRAQDARSDLKKAQEFYGRAAALAPGQEDIVIAYADLLTQTLDYEKIAEAMRQALKAADRAVFHERLSDALARLKKWDEAFEEMVKAWSLTTPQPITLSEETYRKSAQIVDARVERLFTSLAKMAVDLDQGKLTREQAFDQLKDLRTQAQSVSKALDVVKPPAAFEESHLHRQTAASLLTQALGTAKTYIDTGAGGYENRVSMLLKTAREEFRSAGAK